MSRGTSLVLDRQYKSIGRIKRSTGTNDKQLLKLLDAMLDTLYRAGRVDLLQAIQRGTLHPLTVWSRYRVGELAQLPTAESMKPLKESMEAWVEQSDTGVWNRASRKYGVHAVLRDAPTRATLEDLPDLLRGYAAIAKGGTMFNRTRSAVQAFLRDTVGPSHPLYAKIRDVRPKRVTPRVGNPQSPEQMAALTKALAPEYAEIAWSMALTGMGPGELWGKWTQYADHIHIQGTKRAGRVRDIPFVRPIARPTRLYRAFHDALEKVTDEVQPYDLRRTFAHAMEMAGLMRSHQIVYLGHATKSMTDLYQRHEMAGFWAADGEKLRAYWGDKVPAAHLRLA